MTQLRYKGRFAKATAPAFAPDARLREMSGDEFEAVCRRLGITMEFAARLCGAHFKTAVRWRANGVSGAAAVLLRVMAAYEISAGELETVLRHAEDR